MATVILSIAILGVAVCLLALRILFGREFRGTCASNNPYLEQEGGACWACGKSDPEAIDTCEHRDVKAGRLVLRRLWKSQ